MELCNDGPVTVELVSSPTPSIASPTSPSTKSAVTAAKRDEDLEAILGQQPYLGGLLGHATGGRYVRYVTYVIYVDIAIGVMTLDKSYLQWRGVFGIV